MKVSELIKKLQDMPQDMNAVVAVQDEQEHWLAGDASEVKMDRFYTGKLDENAKGIYIDVVCIQ